MRNSRPQVVAILPSTIASCQIGVIRPLSALAQKGHIRFKWHLEGRASINAIHAADVVIFCRNTEPAYTHMLNEAVSTNKPIIYDLDDNFWDVPFDSDPELARYHRLPLRIQQLEKYISQSNLVRVYSPVLEDIVGNFNKNVRLLKAGFDFSVLRKPRHKRFGEKIQIVYATSRIVDNQYKLFSEAIRMLLDAHNDKVELTIWGCRPSELVGHRGVRVVNLVHDYARFLEDFSAQGFDIGLAPLEDTPFHRSKTNTKFRDYGACRIAGVYSDVPVYSHCVENNVTGVLVKNTTEDWLAGILRLVHDGELRASIEKSAYDEVLANYSQGKVENEWLAQINELLAESTVYSLSSQRLSKPAEILIRADFQDLAGIRIPASSPGDSVPVGKVFLTVMTPQADVLREASTTAVSTASNQEDLVFSFAPIRNSKDQDFVLKFTRVPDSTNQEHKEYWLPHSGYVEMVYGSGPANSNSSQGVKSSKPARSLSLALGVVE